MDRKIRVWLAREYAEVVLEKNFENSGLTRASGAIC
jgi:hypothetical protein